MYVQNTLAGDYKEIYETVVETHDKLGFGSSRDARIAAFNTTGEQLFSTEEYPTPSKH